MRMLRFFTVPRLARNPDLFFEIGYSNMPTQEIAITIKTWYLFYDEFETTHSRYYIGSRH